MNFAPEAIEWQNRAVSLDPCAVTASDEAAVNLAQKLLRLDDESLENFQGAGAKSLIFIAGRGDALPWADGAIYLGRDARISALFLLPTTVEPKISIDLFKLVLEKKFRHKLPCVVLPGKIISFGAAKKLSRAVLEKWLTENK